MGFGFVFKWLMDGHNYGWPILYRIKEGLARHQQGLRISRRRQGGDVNPGNMEILAFGAHVGSTFKRFSKAFCVVAENVRQEISKNVSNLLFCCFLLCKEMLIHKSHLGQ